MVRDVPGKRDMESAGLSPVVMAHVFRGELSRSDTWRTRLDTTTNWALTTTAAVISFGFSTASSHVTFLVGLWMVVSFLMIEARRYRYYDLWNRRLRLLEEGYWAPLLRKEPIDPDSIKELAREMERPQIQLSLFSAVATRVNRTYGPILLVLLLAWFVKVYSHPHAVMNVDEFFDRAHIGPLPGAFVTGILVLVSLYFVVLVIASMVARPPMGELRTRPRSRSFSILSAFQPYAMTEPRKRRRAQLKPTKEPEAKDGADDAGASVY